MTASAWCGGPRRAAWRCCPVCCCPVCRCAERQEVRERCPVCRDVCAAASPSTTPDPAGGAGHLCCVLGRSLFCFPVTFCCTSAFVPAVPLDLPRVLGWAGGGVSCHRWKGGQRRWRWSLQETKLRGRRAGTPCLPAGGHVRIKPAPGMYMSTCVQQLDAAHLLSAAAAVGRGQRAPRHRTGTGQMAAGRLVGRRCGTCPLPRSAQELRFQASAVVSISARAVGPLLLSTNSTSLRTSLKPAKASPESRAEQSRAEQQQRADHSRVEQSLCSWLQRATGQAVPR